MHCKHSCVTGQRTCESTERFSDDGAIRCCCSSGGCCAASCAAKAATRVTVWLPQPLLAVSAEGVHDIGPPRTLIPSWQSMPMMLRLPRQRAPIRSALLPASTTTHMARNTAMTTALRTAIMPTAKQNRQRVLCKRVPAQLMVQTRWWGTAEGSGDPDQRAEGSLRPGRRGLSSPQPT
jgi:hypothetical protein